MMRMKRKKKIRVQKVTRNIILLQMMKNYLNKSEITLKKFQLMKDS
jgi:hypothetical protein